MLEMIPCDWRLVKYDASCENEMFFSAPLYTSKQVQDSQYVVSQLPSEYTQKFRCMHGFKWKTNALHSPCTM